MKKLRVAGAAFALAMGISSTGLAADETPSSGGVFFNPLGLVFGLVSGDVGIGLGDKLSLSLGGNYWSFNLLGTEYTNWGLSGGIQYFFTGQLYHGFYVKPVLNYESVSLDYSSGTDLSGSAYGPGVTVGYQWDWKPFSLRLGGGTDYWLTSLEDTEVSGVGLALDASIGFTW